MPSLLIIPEMYPGLCNSLFAYSSIYALRLKSHRSLFYLYLGEHQICKSRRAWKRIISYNLKLLSTYFLKVIQRLSVFMPSIVTTLEFFPDSKISLISSLSNCKQPVIFIRGWGYHDIELMSEFRSEILHHLGVYPKNSLNSVARKYRSPLILGVHVRRKDYKTFLGGRYYYHPDVYRLWIKHALRQIKDQNVEVRFFSDDPSFVKANFLDIGSLASGTALEDLHALSKCDFILGPPSTFTMWAAFVSGSCRSMHIYQSSPRDSDQFTSWQTLATFNATTS